MLDLQCQLRLLRLLVFNGNGLRLFVCTDVLNMIGIFELNLGRGVMDATQRAANSFLLDRHCTSSMVSHVKENLSESQ